MKILLVSPENEKSQIGRGLLDTPHCTVHYVFSEGGGVNLTFLKLKFLLKMVGNDKYDVVWCSIAF